jgi:acetate kinase
MADGPGNVLVVNAGSSSLKLRLLGPGDRTLWTGDRSAPAPGAEAAGGPPAAGGGPPRVDMRGLFAELADAGGVDAVGHRFVHGGPRLVAPTVLDPDVEAELRARVSLAPLHLPAALAGVAAVRAAAPELPQIACFDTAFHATLPPAASTYAIPVEWRERYGIRRYGFHGLSHAYAARRAGELLAGPDAPAGPGRPRVVTCHLGSGSSLAAVAGGIGRDTTMGFTPLDGLVMGTRSGTVDPGALVWLLRQAGLSADELGEGLERRSGLLGLAGSADMRRVLAAAAAGEDRARLALDVYLHRLRGLIASMAAAIGGLDALVFTGGIGEAAAEIRAGAVAGLGFLGLELDAARNAAHRPGVASARPGDGGGSAPAPDAEIGAAGAPARVFVVEAREDIEIARGVRSLWPG